MQRVHVDAVGDLTRRADHGVTDGGDVDLDVLVAVAARPAHRREQAEPVEAALVGERRLTAERRQRGAHGQHVVAHAGDGRVELDAVAPLDVRPHLAAEPEPEATVGRLGKLPRRLRREHRAAREGDGDARRQVQVGCGLVGGGDRQPRRLAHLREHDPGEPGAGHLAGELLDVRQGGRFGHHVDVHARILRGPGTMRFCAELLPLSGNNCV